MMRRVTAARGGFHAMAEEIRQNPAFVNKIWVGWPPVFSADVNPIDVFSIYIHLVNAADLEDLDAIQAPFIEYLQLHDTVLEEDGLVSTHQYITQNLFMLIMMQNTERYADLKLEFSAIIDTLKSSLNSVFDRAGNTPIIWSIANTNLHCFHQLMDALERSGMRHAVNMDTHCRDFCRGSALFLACVKGEMHQDDEQPFSNNPQDKMESAIRRLLDLGASPTDKSESEVSLSPLEIVTMRRSPRMFKLLLEHLPAPLTEDEISRINILLKLSKYNQIESTINNFSSIHTLPTKSEWHDNLAEMEILFAEYMYPREGVSAAYSQI